MKKIRHVFAPEKDDKQHVFAPEKDDKQHCSRCGGHRFAHSLVVDREDDPRLGYGIDAVATAQHGAYLVLSDEERRKGFVRPVRRAYIHVGPRGGPVACLSKTTMSEAIAETYARDPGFYGATYCVSCQKHLQVGADGEFVWDQPEPPFRTQADYVRWLAAGERVGT